MHQALDARLQFHERAVGHQVDHLAFDLGADGVFLLDAVPGIGQLLLEAQADPFLLAVDVQHHHVNVLAHLEDFRRVADPAPAHIGDVEQTVDAVEVDERAEIGDVLDRALADVARGHLGEEFLAALQPFLFDQFAPGQDDVLAFLVDLDDLEIVSIAHILGEVLGGDDINLGRGQEGLDADVDEQAALDDRLDLAADRAAFVADGQDPLPVLLEFGFLLGQDHHAFAVLELLNQHVDLVAGLHDLDVVKFAPGDDALALVADIDEDLLGTNFDDDAFDNITGRKGHGASLLHGLFHCEHT